MKLHLGCNSNRKDGWTNVDIIPGPGVDFVSSAHELPTVEDESVEEILCEHMLEHLTFYEAQRALAEWYRVLQFEGVLTIEVPDLLGLCKSFIEATEYERFQSNKGHWALVRHMYGNQTGRTAEEQLSQVHKSGYTECRLYEMLFGVGFRNVDNLSPVKDTPGASVIRVRATK